MVKRTFHLPTDNVQMFENETKIFTGVIESTLLLSFFIECCWLELYFPSFLQLLDQNLCLESPR